MTAEINYADNDETLNEFNLFKNMFSTDSNKNSSHKTAYVPVSVFFTTTIKGKVTHEVKKFWAASYDEAAAKINLWTVQMQTLRREKVPEYINKDGTLNRSKVQGQSLMGVNAVYDKQGKKVNVNPKYVWNVSAPPTLEKAIWTKKDLQTITPPKNVVDELKEKVMTMYSISAENAQRIWAEKDLSKKKQIALESISQYEFETPEIKNNEIEAINNIESEKGIDHWATKMLIPSQQKVSVVPKTEMPVAEETTDTIMESDPYSFKGFLSNK